MRTFFENKKKGIILFMLQTFLNAHNSPTKKWLV